VLAYIFRVLADAHEYAGSLSVDWNAVWFDHVNVGLNQLRNGISRVAHLDADAYFAEHLYAAFSLPTPENGYDKRYKSAHQSKSAIINAINSFWISAAEIELSLAMLDNSAVNSGIPGWKHSLSNLDWTLFDATSTSDLSHGSGLLSWAVHEENANNRIQHFSQLTEEDFFNPRKDSQGALEITDPTESKRVFRIDGSSTYVIHDAVIDEANKRITSPNVHVEVPVLQPLLINQQDVQNSDAKLVIRRNGNFQGPLVHANDLHFDGNLHLDFSASRSVFKINTRVNNLTLQVDQGDSLSGKVSPSAAASFLIVPPSAVGVFIFPIKDNGAVDSPIIVAPNQFTNGSWIALENQEVELATNSRYEVVAFADSPNAVVTLNGRVVDPITGGASVWITESFVASGLDRLSIDQFEIVFTSESDSETSPESPIVAAILKVSHALSEPKSVHRDSIRGDLEDFYSRKVVSGDWESSMGHVIVPSDMLGSIDDVSTGRNHQDFEMSSEMSSLWSQLGHGNVSDDFKNSHEVQQFRKAFSELDIAKYLLRDTGEGAKAISWVSKTSWKHLADNETALNSYLDAYQMMVKKSYESRNFLNRVWAAYPFSCSIWRTSGASRILGVMLSPLHPIRLAWIAKMEKSLRNASNAPEFSGTIEGWNFPLIGPSNSDLGKLIAIPSDTDIDQLFLGWSMMVNVSIDGHGIVESPTFAGSRKLPGTSNAGLNATTVRSALRDFRRLHPHVSTLTIDLAARSKSSKVRELDEAVIEEYGFWASQFRFNQGLVGGLRVFDSLNREGAKPDVALNSLTNGQSSPITWKRYQDNAAQLFDAGSPSDANIRILQDSGVAVEVTENSGDTSGLIGWVPFRRFEIPKPIEVIQNGDVRSYPIIRNVQSASSFANALQAIERPLERSLILLKLSTERSLRVDHSPEYAAPWKGINPAVSQ
jgi:hypothetical protein